MSLQCPHCQILQAQGNKACINCGQPLTPAPAAPAASAALGDPALLAEADAAAHLADRDVSGAADSVHVVQVQRDSWRLPALIVVGLILALVAAALRVTPRKSAGPAVPPVAQVPAAAAPVSGEAPPLPSPSPAVSPPPTGTGAKAEMTAAPAVETIPAAMPLTISLTSASAGRHVKVGDAVTLTAFAALAHGQSATLTLFSRRGRGQKTMFGFGQGSLWSGPWTAPAPGRYELAATALDDHRRAASSRPIEIIVDRIIVGRPAMPGFAPAVPGHAPAAPRLAHRPPPAAVPPPSPAAPPPPIAAHVPHPATPQAYHVAAAFFFYRRSAEVLADALNRRGYHAVPERMTGPQGKTVYVVLTGTYRRPSDARKEVLDLQRSGYQAYFFSGP